MEERGTRAYWSMTLKTISTSDLQAELLRREKTVRDLANRRDKLARELAELDRELAELGAPTAPTPRRRAAAEGDALSADGSALRVPRARARNAVSLADALAQCMEIRAVVTPAEAAEMVIKNGYTSTSKNLGMMVSNALARDPRFKRVSRGQYERVG